MNSPWFPFAGRIVVIAPECMGYRSLSAMAFLALFLVLWKRPGLLRSLALVSCAGALAVLGNICRIGFLLAVLKLFDDDAIFNYCHDAAGYVVMIIEALVLASIYDKLCTKTENNTKEHNNGNI